MATQTELKLTAKQESFCQFYLVLRNATQSAIKAGYSPHLIDTHSNHLLENARIKARLAELQAQKPKDPDVADFEERQKRLTEIVRADLTDFVGINGEPELSKVVPHHQAASDYTISTTYTRKGDPIVRKVIKLRDPVAAIQELNKMEHVYETGARVNVLVEIKEVEVRLSHAIQGQRSSEGSQEGVGA